MLHDDHAQCVLTSYPHAVVCNNLQVFTGVHRLYKTHWFLSRQEAPQVRPQL
jgi:hypothetical protein